MTQPEEVPTALEQYVSALLAIEEATADVVESIFKPIMRRLFARLLVLWPGDDAPLEAQRAATDRLNVEELQPALARARAAIKSGAREALSAGLSAALGQAEVAGVDVPELPPSATHLSLATHAKVDQLERTMAHKVAKAKVLMRHSTTQDEVVAALAIAQQGVNSAVSVARTVVNETSNQALSTVSHSVAELVSVWRAERDGCVHCLAYAGQIDNGDGYPAGLTFGKTPLSSEAVEQPPLHPNCRCTQSLVHRDVAAPLAQALQREAKRSVLRGWSRPSESEKVRVDAAKRLLNRGSALPKSVKDYARKAVKSGEFPRGRDFPA